MVATKPIMAAIEAIPGKKENLRKAFEALHAHSSALSAFNLQWKDLEDYITSVERSIDDRLRELEAKEGVLSLPIDPVQAIDPVPSEEEQEVEPRPELKSLCVKMDGKGLLRFICRNRKDILIIGKELSPAIRASPDPAKLVLDAVKGFYPAAAAESPFDGELYATRRNCILLLESLLAINAEIKPLIREKAVALAKEWKAKVPQDGGKNYVDALGFLQLLASYKIMSEFDANELLDLLVPVVKRKQSIDLCKNLGLSEKVPDFIKKLSEKGKYIGAVKFIYAFGLVDQFPPVPLLEKHIEESKKLAQEVRQKGHFSAQSKNEATAKEISALNAVIKTIEEYKLESEYSPKSLQKRIEQLEQQKPEKRRYMPNPVLTLQYPSSKRPRPSNLVPMPPLLSSHYMQSQPRPGLVDRPPYAVSSGSYGVGSGSYIYERSSSAYGSNPMGLGGIPRSPPRSGRYADPPPGSALFDRPGAYSNFSRPGGLSSQYNSSLYR